MNTKKQLTAFIFFFTTLFFFSSAPADEKKHVVFVIGTPHYNPSETMPSIARQLEENYSFRCSIVTTNYNPEKNEKGIPGLQKLSEADIVVFFLRFLTIPEDQLAYILSYIQSGKPVVGLRTTSHAFAYPKGHKLSHWNDGFGSRVLGSKYFIHGKGTTQVDLASSQAHQILDGLDFPRTAAGTLYLSDIPENAISILRGTGEFKKSGKITNAFGTHQISKTMTDDIAWTWENEWGGKVVSTSLGHPQTFADEQWVRFIVNAIHWAAGEPIPQRDSPIKAVPGGVNVNHKYKKPQ